MQHAVQNHDRITVLTDATANGWFADHWLPVVRGNRLIKLRARSTVVAAGALEQPMVCRQNDLPGVMLGSAAQRLVRQYGVNPGRYGIVVTANGDGYGVALDLEEAGVEVIAVLDLRTDPPDDPRLIEVERRGILIRPGLTVAEVGSTQDRSHLAGIKVGRIESQGLAQETGEILACNVLCMSVGAIPTAHLALHGGGPPATTTKRLPASASPTRQTASSRRAPSTAIWIFSAAIADGAAAGAAAATAAGHAGAMAEPPAAAPAGYNHPYPVFPHLKGKDFVDFDEDQTYGDVLQGLTEGFDHVELLKRYTTIGMGPSQGRHSALKHGQDRSAGPGRDGGPGRRHHMAPAVRGGEVRPSRRPRLPSGAPHGDASAPSGGRCADDAGRPVAATGLVRPPPGARDLHPRRGHGGARERRPDRRLDVGWPRSPRGPDAAAFSGNGCTPSPTPSRRSGAAAMC